MFKRFVAAFLVWRVVLIGKRHVGDCSCTTDGSIMGRTKLSFWLNGISCGTSRLYCSWFLLHAGQPPLAAHFPPQFTIGLLLYFGQPKRGRRYGSAGRTLLSHPSACTAMQKSLGLRRLSRDVPKRSAAAFGQVNFAPGEEAGAPETGVFLKKFCTTGRAKSEEIIEHKRPIRRRK